MKMNARFFITLFALSGAIVIFGSAWNRPAAAVDALPVAVTFTKDVAPIMYANCAVCHHSGGSAPFSLMTYAEVRKRAAQIVDVTKSRYMPPWLPEPGHGEFVGARRLSQQQLSILRQWAEQGTPEGAPANLPPAPKFNEGWQLGQPDVVIKMPSAYTLRADGQDVFRNFVIPVPLTKTRYVKAIEILPGNKKVVHHANILIDRARSSRQFEGKDGELGFAGMSISIESEKFDPDSHFLFWKPGTPPSAEPEGTTWPLDKGTDLVLNMHLQPSGKPELIQPSIGIYFSDKPPTKFPMLLQLERDGALDIPAGEKNFIVTDTYKLPLDVDLLGLYPHAHYLGKDFQSIATLPDGTQQKLIRIKDWDINWQSVYHYAKPLFLPKGTVISMRWTYDNSNANPRNPNNPPRRVVSGNNSTDEMSHLWLQVLPRGAEDHRIVLQESIMRHWLQKYPRDFTAHFNLGAVLQSLERGDEAILEYNEALRSKPDDAVTRNSLGTVLQAKGLYDDAIKQYQEALRLKPDYTSVHYNWGNALLAAGQPEAAVSHFQQVLRVNPADADARNNLGTAFAMLEDLPHAAEQFTHALRLNADHPLAHSNLGGVLAKQGQVARAAAEYEQALRVNPKDADAHNELGQLLVAQGRLTQAIAHFEQALRFAPQHEEAKENLRRTQEQLKRKPL
jgi:tetratricopeptide (TPR) repeat protein